MSSSYHPRPAPAQARHPPTRHRERSPELYRFSPGWDAALSEEPQVSLMDAVMNNTGFLTNIKQQYDYVFTDLRDPR